MGKKILVLIIVLFLFSSPTVLAMVNKNTDSKRKCIASIKGAPLVMESVTGNENFYQHCDGPELLDGWPVTLCGNAIVSYPVAYDFDNDGKKEVVIGTLHYDTGEGRVYVINSDGTIARGWPVITDGIICCSPSIGDLDNDGAAEIVVYSHKKSVYVLRFDGSIVWKKDQQIGEDFVYPAPVLADVDNDGFLDIILWTNYKIFVWDHKGNDVVGWPVTIKPDKDWMWGRFSQPVVGDIDRDGYVEIVVNTEDDKTYVLNHDGSIANGWPVSFPSVKVLCTNVLRPPVLGDLDGNGYLEIVRDGYSKLYVLKYDGSIAPGWPQPVEEEGHFPFALGDIDSDGLPEIIFGRFDWMEYTYAFNGDGTQVPGWPFARDPYSSQDGYAAMCAVVDIDSDGSKEIIARNCWGTDGKIWVLNSNGTLLEDFLLTFPNTPPGEILLYAPGFLLADLNNDGHLDIIAPQSSTFEPNIRVYAWTLPTVYSSPEWPMYQNNILHTGVYNTGVYNHPPVKPSLDGPSLGKTKVEYTYKSSTTDHEGNKIYYWFDWGDGTNSGWIGPYSSGEIAEITHSWIKKGAYNVKVKAKDEHGIESEWSQPLKVRITNKRDVSNPLFAQQIATFSKKYDSRRVTYILKSEKLVPLIKKCLN